ncbi:jacalin-related lectin 25-like [Nicotiana tabacum]|uniref:Jacalin-related lectin 25-like n=1 Tax=Nicotiana tabacum TaxID=4097 RepID=A0AC58SM62_TOBAC
MDLIKVGPVGGQAGSFWDEKGRDQVAGIFVSYNKNAVESLQFLFYESGNLVLSNKHGVFYHTQKNFTVLVLFSFFREQHKKGSFLHIYTNKGSYGPFGCTRPSIDARDFNFQMENRRLFGGFHGSENGYGVESIGIYVKPIIPSMINLRIHE